MFEARTTAEELCMLAGIINQVGLKTSASLTKCNYKDLAMLGYFKRMALIQKEIQLLLEICFRNMKVKDQNDN